jgi:ABC-type hemin transport system ATPase subunit
VPVLSDVDLELDPGEVVALVGPPAAEEHGRVGALGFAAPTAGR